LLGTRVFLGLSAVVWLPYGIFCFLQPAFLSEAAGIAFASPTATTELRAMYGGLQAGIGSLALLAVVRPTLARPALITLAFLCVGLGVTRLAGAFWDDSFSPYTSGALAFEFASSALAIFLLSRHPLPSRA
jgi:hypothetical protein